MFFLDCRAVGRLTIVLEGNNYIGGDSYLNMYASSTSNKDTPRYMGIWGNTVIFSGSGSLTVKTQMYPIQAGGVQVLGNATLNLYSHMDGTAVKQMEVCSGATVNAEVQGSELPYCGLKVSKSGSGNGSLTVSGTLSVTTKGCQYGSSSSLLLAPIALYVPDNSILIDGGIMTVIANGRKNGGDGCQSYGIAAKSIKLDHGGRVEAYSRGYNSKTNTYDGKEAIYLTDSLEVGINCRLYAKIENPQFNNDDTYGAIKVNGEQWILEKTDQDSGGTYTTAVVTNPVNGYPRGKAVYGFRASAAKEVEIRGLTEAMLVLSYCKSNTNEGKTYYYRNAETPGDTDSDRQKIYQYASRPNVELNLQEGFGTIRPLDYNSYYGIDVKQSEHTIVMEGLTILRDHTFITVRGGATLNLKLANWSYLGCGRGGSAPTIQVEAGGTLNITGVSMNKTSLALAGGIAAESGATVNIKNCAVYVPGKTIGDSGAAVTIENSWASSDYAGNLLVKTSTLEGKYAGGGTVKIDRGSNANLTDASGKAVTGVTDHSGNAVYRTKIALEDMDKSRNKTAITYRTDSNPNGVTLRLFPKVTLLRVNVPSSANDTVITGLNIPVDNNIIYLWLPAGTKIINVEGFQDDGSSPVGFIHDPGQNAQIITTADNNASGTLILRNLLLGSGILALKGTPAGNNTQICAGYLNDNTKDKWIGYDPAKEIKLEADVPYVKEFGIRMLTGGEAEVKLNGLYLSGPNKRVEVDNGAKLSVILMENTENSMAAASGTDAVWTLKGSGGLTIKGQSGGEKLKLAGDHAIDGSTGASLTLDGITLVNLCTKKQETALGSLTINGSTVLGLGALNCANVVINGGSVDLDVPVNTVVKDSGGNELKKVTLTLSEKNTAVEDVTLSGLPEGTAFNDSHITSDGSGKLYLWIPKDAEVETVTVGGNKYYPKSDGSMTIGDVPEFTSPTEDVSRVVEIIEYMTLTVEVTGTPAPALQWQVSRDGGKTWENIEGATKATYQAELPFSLHGAKFRCAATNKDGTTYSHTFTAYYCPAYLRGAASPMRGNGDFIQGEIATITAGFYDGQTRYPISSLTGVTAEYRWKICGNDAPTEEEWAAILPAGESYPITITDEMNYQYARVHVTLTYPDNTVKTVNGLWRLLVCVTPVVTEQPQSVSAAVGDSVTFSAKLIKQYLNALEYQWQSSADGGQNWTDIEGAGGISSSYTWNYIPSYTIPSVTAAQSGQLFRCVLWNTNNHTGSDRVSTPPVYSEPATLTVTPPAHEHRYGDWSRDGTNHWHECTDAACPNQSESIKDTEAHIYDDDADTTCNVCGYVRTLTPEIVPVSQITLNKAETSISVGNSETLTATVAPENATIKALTWASSDEDVATVAPDGTVTAVKAGAATITATAADGSGKSAVCTVTVTGDTTPSQPGGSTGGSSGGSSSDRDSHDSNPVIKTETKNNTDGSTTKTETRRDGSVTQTTTGKDGSVTKTETKKDGSSVTENKAADGSTGTVKTDKNGQIEAAAKVSGKAVEDAKKNGEAVKVPVEVEATRNSSTAPTVSIELPKGTGETKVEIPVSNVTPGTVAVLVHPDGTEELLKDSIPTEDGIQLTVDGSATVKIVDNSKGFIDTQDHWAKDEIDFVSARGLVNGMSATIYAPNNSTTRAQLWTILARQADEDLTGGNTWYEKAQNWAKAKGISDGANPNAAINRAQMVTMLWRAMGQPTEGCAANFTDVPTDSYYAQAVAWAVENGITTGIGNGKFDPNATCTRAQIAAFLARSMK